MNCGGGGRAWAIIILVIVAIVILIGLFFGIVLATMLVSKVIQRHMYIIRREEEARVQIVANLANSVEAERSVAIEPKIMVKEEHEPLVLNGDASDFEAKKLASPYDPPKGTY